MRARGACTKSPSVRACVGAGPSASCPRRGWSGGAEEQRRHGAGFPSACPASSAGLKSGSSSRDGRGATAQGVASSRVRWGSLRYSMTRQRGRCCEKYLKSSGVAPGQLVSSSSSSSCSCTRPDSPVVVRSGQPASARHGDCRSAAQLCPAEGLDWAGQEGKAGEVSSLLGVGPTIGLMRQVLYWHGGVRI